MFNMVINNREYRTIGILFLNYSDIFSQKIRVILIIYFDS